MTIVLPVWGSYVTYLHDTVASLQSQIPQPRVLIVDNASAVPVPSVPGADVVRTPRPLSVGAARSYGLARVATEFVVVWDVDDIMPPGTLTLLTERITHDPNLSLVAALILDGVSGRRLHWPRRGTAPLARFPTAFAFLQCVWSVVPTIGAIMRTDTARDAGGFLDLDTGDDWALGASLALRGRVALIDHIGRVYTQHSDSVWSRRQSQSHLFQHARAVRNHVSVDPAAPKAIKRSLPLIAFLQWTVILLVRPVARFFRARGRVAGPIR